MLLKIDRTLGRARSNADPKMNNASNNNDSIDMGNNVEKGQKTKKGKTVLMLGFILFLL